MTKLEVVFKSRKKKENDSVARFKWLKVDSIPSVIIIGVETCMDGEEESVFYSLQA